MLNKKFFPLNWNVNVKNTALCQQLMALQPIILDQNKQPVENQIISYLLTTDMTQVPKVSGNCKTFLNHYYDYAQAEKVLNRIFNNKKLIGRSPYLVVYKNANTNDAAILSLGELSPHSIQTLGKKWGQLIEHTYQHGSAVDPIFGISTLIENDPEIDEAEKQAFRDKIKTVATGALCGGGVVGTTVTLNTLLSLPACQAFINDTKKALVG